MNAQETINRLMGLRHAVPGVSGALDGPSQFIDNVNTQLIDAMLVLEATFLSDGAVVNMATIGPRIAAIHELVQSAWQGRQPADQALEVVAMIKSHAVIGDAMRGPEA